MRVALGLEYDGVAFCGWQKQSDVVTLQAALESALAVIAQELIAVTAAGRTDTGVHALMQVVHFDTNVKREMSSWVRGVNSHLPKGMVVRFAKEVTADFHARFDAFARSYRYVLSASAVRPAVLSGKVGWTHLSLDLNLMKQAALLLIGEHDFSSFRSSECQAKSPVKTMTKADVYQDNSLFCFDFEGNAFLHHMVRNLVGALIYVGSGRMNMDQFAELLVVRNRQFAPPTFMPDGLYLTGVHYPEHFGLNDHFQVDTWLWGKND